jgi:hypothetical protein
MNDIQSASEARISHSSASTRTPRAQPVRPRDRLRLDDRAGEATQRRVSAAIEGRVADDERACPRPGVVDGHRKA